MNGYSQLAAHTQGNYLDTQVFCKHDEMRDRKTHRPSNVSIVVRVDCFLYSRLADRKLLQCDSENRGEIAWCQPGRKQHVRQGWQQHSSLSLPDVRNHCGQGPRANALCRMQPLGAAGAFLTLAGPVISIGFFYTHNFSSFLF